MSRVTTWPCGTNPKLRTSLAQDLIYRLSPAGVWKGELACPDIVLRGLRVHYMSRCARPARTLRARPEQPCCRHSSSTTQRVDLGSDSVLLSGTHTADS